MLIGIVVSALYFYFIAQYYDCSLTQFTKLKPNTLGDFLAGAFAPLAFLWLVLGYFQQGKALQTQIKELHETVKHQADVAKTAKARCNPIFKMTKPIQVIAYKEDPKSYEPSHYVVTATYRNVGETVTALSFYFSGINQAQIQTHEVVNTNDEFTISIRNQLGQSFDRITAIVTCRTILKERYERKYIIVNNDVSIIPIDINIAQSLNITIEEVGD